MLKSNKPPFSRAVRTDISIIFWRMDNGNSDTELRKFFCQISGL